MKVLKPIGITVAVIVVLITIAAIIAPPIAKHYIIKHSKEMIGRQINMDGLYANLFTGYTRITGFELLDTNGRDRFVSFDSLIVKISLFRLFANELKVNRIRLVNPDIRVWQKGSDFNFSDLLQTPPVASTSLDAPPTDTLPQADPMAIALNHIAIVGGNLSYQDLVVGSNWNTTHIQLYIPGVYFSGKNTDIGLNLNFSEGGSLHTKMQYNLEAGTYLLSLQLNGFAIDNLLPYLQQSLNVGQIKGILSADLQVQGNTAHALDMSIKGMTGLKQFHLLDPHQKEIFSAGELAVNIANINPEKQQFRFNEIRIQNLKSYFDLYPQSNTFSQLMKSDTRSAPIPQEESSPADTSRETPDFLIHKFSVDSASLTFNDHTLPEAFHFAINDMCINASDFTLSGKNRVNIKSSLENGGTIALHWNGRLDDISNQDLNLYIQNLDLKIFSPYSIHYFGYPLQKGVLAFTSINNIRNHYLDGRNKLDIYRCEVDKKRKDIQAEFNIPLRTALYIIKDVNDQIKMDLPVKGNINSPSFSYKKIILKTLTNLLVKVAVSPFSFLANSLGMASHDLKDIPFDVYRGDFTPEQFSLINQLATVLKAKPEMTLELQQYYNPEQAVKALALFQAQKTYYLSMHPEISDTTLQAIDYVRISEISTKDIGFQSYLSSQIPAENQTTDLYTQILTFIPAEELSKQIQILADLRDQKLKDYLLHQGLTEKNIQIIAVPTDSLLNYKGKNCYNFQLTLEDEKSFLQTKEITKGKK